MDQGWIQGGDWDDRLKPTKATFSNIILYNSEKAPAMEGYFAVDIVLSQQCCEVYFISLTVVNPS